MRTQTVILGYLHLFISRLSSRTVCLFALHLSKPVRACVRTCAGGYLENSTDVATRTPVHLQWHPAPRGPDAGHFGILDSDRAHAWLGDAVVIPK